METNYDRFMDMSVMELAEMFSEFCLQMAGCNACPLKGKCPDTEAGGSIYSWYTPAEWEAWLRKEGEE